MEDNCTCGMCPHLPPNQIITGAYHQANPDMIIGIGELCAWHKGHGNEGLYYLIADINYFNHNRIQTENDIDGILNKGKFNAL